MRISKVIENLEMAENPSRNLDGQVALALGYTKKVETKTDPETGVLIPKNRWYAFDSKKPVTVPNYTTSLDAARDLAKTMSGGAAGGVSWGADKCSAQIGDGPICHAATIAIALCIAALKLRQEQTNGS